MDVTPFKLELTRDGTVFDPKQLDCLVQGVAGLTDLFVISHGWNNNTHEANELYDELLTSFAKVLKEDVIPGFTGRTFGMLRIYWPSKKFDDAALIPAGGTASVEAANDAKLDDLLERLKHDPLRLDGDDTPPTLGQHVKAAQEAVKDLETSAAARATFVEGLRGALASLSVSKDETENDEPADFFTEDPEELFKRLKEPVHVDHIAGAGGAAGVGGAANVFVDAFEGIRGAARQLANLATYYRMKERAGNAGRKGLAPALQAVRENKPGLSLHLIGHSFGGRLVTAAATALPASATPTSLSLLQAAFSHNGFAKDAGNGKPGVFRDLIEGKRITGPIIVTHTKRDLAVGVAYPLASRLARDRTAALGDAEDPYGGIGRNGAQHTEDAVKREAERLLPVGEAYKLSRGGIFNLKADDFISGHSDVRGVQVAFAILSAVARANAT